MRIARGATLAVLLPLVELFRHRLRQGGRQYRPSDPLVLEALLSSHVFRARFTEEQKQLVLDTIAGYTDSRAAQIATAHGARLDTDARRTALQFRLARQEFASYKKRRINRPREETDGTIASVILLGTAHHDEEV